MPKRPKQHRLEDKSRIRFQDILPDMWVYRDKDKDYGIDAEVELFGQNEKPQGLIFFVQLKATESKEKSTILNVDFKIETLKYYKSLDIPVLLVRYSDYDNSIYIKWVNNIDFFYAKDNAKTIRIKLAEKDKWNKETHSKIEIYLKKARYLKAGSFRFPLPIEISIDQKTINGLSKGILLTQIKRELKEHSEFINIQDENKSLIKISLNNNVLKIDASNLAGCSFHSIELQDKKDFSKNLSKDILIGIAFSMIQLGQIEYCGRIIFENNLESKLIEKKELLVHFIIPLFHSSFFEETLSIFEEILINDNDIGLKIISNFHMLMVSDKKNEKANKIIEEFLKRQIERAKINKDKQLIGIANYNLGNHYSNRAVFFQAIHHFNLARKFAPIYLKQQYFYSEIASVLFRYGKYIFASNFYLKSLKLKSDNHTLALYADALMFAGEYEKSIKKFGEYLDKSDKPIEEFVLKKILLELILKKHKIKKQTRNEIEANKYAEIKKANKNTNLLQQLEKALTFDLLSGLAWFNFGIIYNEKNNFDDATICFTMAALLNTEDVESWKNATLSSFNAKNNLSFIPLIIITAFYFNGEYYLEELYKDIEKQGNSELLSMFAERIEEILPKNHENKQPTVRILNKKGKFENIEEIIKNERKY